ncbi:extracellular solute-binding protein [Iodobacter fluviatilis]|uniref:Putrescine-binding periplasmic protein n=1 Tax=Iodobacter fluviatilis TaxID=537 RepID=A0A377Q340_9NEIS|nr:extracellular solute-binding protein [Iodobacter fluviatilis]TCU90326.1 putative spermidine/putrescine transport system substrate-binding protein [Iodobacter fluviatilis]STQ89353.1 Putrescine-binding periplasmic protein precursor [Iodobacter fluviatilis]
MKRFFLRSVFGLLCVSASSTAWAAEVLRVLAWPGYADSDWVSEFEKRFDARVEVTFIDTDEALWDKLSKNRGENFDVFAANTAEMQRYIDQAIAAPVKPVRIPNTKKQLPRFRRVEKIPSINRDGYLYAIPFVYSEMGLIYDKKQIKQAPVSMNELWNKKYIGKVVLHDGSNHNFSFTALTIGIKDPFNLNKQEMARSVNRLLELRDQKPFFYNSPEEGTQAFIKNKAALMFANYGMQQLKLLRAAGADVGYIVPKEGALAWLDCWAISIKAKNKMLAENWINFMLDKSVSNELTQRQGLANTLSKSNLSARDKIIWIQSSEDFALRSQYWDRIRAGNARNGNNRPKKPIL